MSTKSMQVLIKIVRSKTVIITAVLLILYTVTGFFLLPLAIERYLPEMLGERLDSNVSLEEVKINPFTLTVEAREFHIAEPSGGAIAGFQRLFVNFQLSSLFRWALTFEEISLDAPSVRVVIHPDGTLNLARFGGGEPPVPETGEEETRPLRMLLRHIAIQDGRIELTDQRQPTPATASFHPLHLQLSDISTLPEQQGDYTLTATGADGAILVWSGQVSLNPVQSSGTLVLKGSPVTTPWEFVRSHLNIASPEGLLGLSTRYSIDLSGETPVMTLDDLRVNLTGVGLGIAGGDRAFLVLPEITVGVEAVDMVQRRVDGVHLAVSGGELDVIADRGGALNLQQLITGTPDSGPSPPEPSQEQETPWTVHISKVGLNGLALRYTDQSRDPALSASTEEIALTFRADMTTGPDGGLVTVDDLDLTLQRIAVGSAGASDPALQVEGLKATGGAFDLGARTAFLSGLELTGGEIDLVRNEDGSINLVRMLESEDGGGSGPESESPAEPGDPWQFLVETISLSGFKAHIADRTIRPDGTLMDMDGISLTLSHVDGTSPIPFEMGLQVVQGGAITASGSLDPAGPAVDSSIAIRDLALPMLQPFLAQAADLTLDSGRLSTQGTFKRTAKGGMAYRGNVVFADLQVTEDMTKDTLLGWKQLAAPDVHLRMDPNGLDIKSVKLTGLEGKLVISEEGKVNVAEAFKASPDETGPGPKEPSSKTDAAPFPVNIGSVTLDKGAFYFADLSLKPQFATRIHELGGVIQGLSSSPGTRTRITLDGRADEYGTSKIRGEINAFDPKQFTDITMVFNNLEMRNLSPYSGKFAGRAIEKGKLSLDLEYKIEDSALKSNNKIVIDSLKLGARVESPDAVNLPLDLAIALMRDAKGIIDIGLPVTGSLDDPEFRLGPLIWKALTNLLTRIVTSPFRALGALFGAGDETLDAVAFEPGSSSVPPPEQEKLDILKKALLERPQLKLAITGSSDREADGRVIRDLEVRRALAEASGALLEPGEDPGPVDFNDPEVAQRLTAIFVERHGQEALDATGVEGTPADTSKDSKEVSEGPAESARRLFSELVEREPLKADVLQGLADARARAIADHLTGPDGLPPERVTVQPLNTAGADDSLSSNLALDVMESAD